MTTILHVEDDASLAEMVKTAFEAFGFRGTYLLATRVEEARRIVHQAGPLDLVICDMNLPDGTGFDVLRDLRSEPTRRHVPIVILSGDIDHATVNRAYALGASSYVSKGMRGRSIAEITKNLYGHWLKDALLPTSTGKSRTYEYVARAVDLRTRKAAMCMRVGEKLGMPDGGFWMDLALREGNFANLLAFLVRNVADHELPSQLLEAAEEAQRAEAVTLADLEPREVRTHDDATRYMRVLVSNIHSEVAAHVIGQLFPVVPVAVSAMRDVASGALDETASWIEMHSADRELREHISMLRADAARFRS